MTSYTQNCPPYTTSDSSGRLDQLLDWSRRYIQKQALKQALSKERAQLKRLSPEMLKDIGIDQVKATLEATRIDIPASRMPQEC
ncbi:MAG: hypothetical protein ACI9GE_000397 [Oceanospirillaceae bacterium]|jgi:uncharacterized protein YjiS (DUF1127 family)